MKCSKAQRMLVDYVEGALSDRGQQAVETHVEACQHCRTELARIRQLRSDIASVAAPEPDAAFWQEFDRKLNRKLAAETTPVPRRTPRRIGFVLGAAAVAAACIVVWLSVRTVSPKGSDELRLARETDTVAGVTVDPTWTYNYDLYGTDISTSDLSTEQSEQLEESIFLLSEGDWSVAPEDLVVNTVYEETLDDMIDEMSTEEMESFFENLRAS